MTGSSTMGAARQCDQSLRDLFDDGCLPDHAYLCGIDAHIGQKRIELFADKLRVVGITPVTARVFCAVSAVTPRRHSRPAH